MKKRMRHAPQDEQPDSFGRDLNVGEDAPSWQALVIRIGERCAEYAESSKASEHVLDCATALERELERSRESVVGLLLQCAEELPQKGPFYAALVGVLNVSNRDFGAAVVQSLSSNLQGSLDSGDCNKLRVLLRFLSLLAGSNVVEPAGVLALYDALLASAVETVDNTSGASQSAWQPRADFFVFCLLASLPFGALDLHQKSEDGLQKVLAKVEAYMSLRKPLPHPEAFHVFQPWEDTEAAQPADYLVDLWASVQSFQEDGWKATSVPRPQDVLAEQLRAGQPHSIPIPSIPPAPAGLPSDATPAAWGREHNRALLAFPARSPRLRIFPPAKSDASMTPIDCFVVKEYLLDVLCHLNGCRKECAAYMVGLPVPFRYDYLMAETVFSQLLLLPAPPFRLIYYAIVLVDLCKALPGAFPAVVAGAVRAFFNRMADVDVECRTRLVQWLSHHLSNFGFVWPWESWAHALAQPPWHPQRWFMAEVLEKEIRLAYWDKIKETLASQKMGPMMPPRATPVFRYSGLMDGAASEAEVKLAADLVALVRAKKGHKDLHAWVVGTAIPTLGSSAAALDLTVQALANLGAKSFTHTLTMLERYAPLLHSLAPTQELQTAVVGSVAELWKNSPQMCAIVVDRCMGFRIVSSLAIVAWAFSPPYQMQFHVSDLVWEVLHNALRKTRNRVSDLRNEVASAGRAAAAASAAASKAREAAAEAQALADVEAEEEAKTQAIARAEWADAKAAKAAEDATSAEEAIEAKQALLMRALHEQEGLLVAIYRSFVASIKSKLASPIVTPLTQNGKEALGAMEEDPAVIGADSSHMDTGDAADAAEGTVHQPSGQDMEPNSLKTEGAGAAEAVANGGDAGSSERSLAENKEWLRCTLGQLRAVTRQYSLEVWHIMEKLDSEVLKDCGQHVLEAVYTGLQRPLS